MKNCPNCQAEVPNEFDICWKCNYDFISESIIKEKESIDEKDKQIDCLRCETRMKYQGTQKFHEGRRYGILGDIGELFVNKTVLDMYVCPSCNKVEFFIA